MTGMPSINPLSWIERRTRHDDVAEGEWNPCRCPKDGLAGAFTGVIGFASRAPATARLFALVHRLVGAMAGAILLQSMVQAVPLRPSDWSWANPGRHGNNIIDMFVGPDRVVQVCDHGQIYTGPNVQELQRRESGTSASLQSVTAHGAGWVIVGAEGTVVLGDAAGSFRPLSLNTSDWLLGVASSGTRLVAVGDNAAIYTSETTTEWTRRTAPTTEWFRSVAYGGNDGVGFFVAVGENGTVATSGEGESWLRVSAFTSEHLQRVSWGGDRFWVVGDQGVVFTSRDGVVWEPVATGAVSALYATAGTATASLVGGDGEVRLRDGRPVWLDQTSDTLGFRAPRWTYYTAYHNGLNFGLAGRTGLVVEGFRNPVSLETVWLPTDGSVRSLLFDLKRFPGLYVAVGDLATILTSLDGVNWDEELVPLPAPETTLLGIGGTTNVAVAVGNSGAILISRGSPLISIRTNLDLTLTTNIISSLGIEWQPVTPRPVTNTLQGITVFRDTFVATGSDGLVLSSPDGTQWTRRPSVTAAFLSSIEATSTRVIAVGRDGTIVRSDDLEAWTAVPSGVSGWIYRVRYLIDRWMAVGQHGVILVSADGLVWERLASGTDRFINDVVRVDNQWFAVGERGLVLMSDDGRTWSETSSVTGKALFAAATFNGQLLTAGSEGVILRSQPAPAESPVRFLTFPREPGQNTFLFSGRANQRFSLDRSVDLQVWTPSVVLEVFSPDGNVLYLDDQTNRGDQQFFRARPVP